MKLLIQSAMIFFGTLLAAALVALGEPAGAWLAVQDPAATPPSSSASLVLPLAANRPR